MLELDRLEKNLEPCPLLTDVGSYLPDTVDLTQDKSVYVLSFDSFICWS